MPIRTHTLDVTIPTDAGALSPAVQLNGLMLEAITMPAAWTAATLAFAVSETEAGTYRPLADFLGTEIQISAAAGAVVQIPMGAVRGHNWLKVQSGTAAVPVVQAAARTLTLLVRHYA